MKQKTYLHWGVTITAAACAILVFYDTFFQDGVLFIFIEKLFGILKPVLYGLAMAYLLTPIVDFFDRLLRDRLGPPFGNLWINAYLQLPKAYRR